MKLIITVEKKDIKTAQNGENLIITNESPVKIILTPEALKEINEDVEVLEKLSL